MKAPSLLSVLTCLCGGLALLLLVLPGPRLTDHLTPLASTPSEADHAHRERIEAALPPGAVVRASVTLAGGVDTSAFLENGDGTTSRHRKIDSLAPAHGVRAASPLTWTSTFLVPPESKANPTPLAFVVAWQGVEPELGAISLAQIEGRYFALRYLLLSGRGAALLAFAAGLLLLLRRRLGPEQFSPLLGRVVLPLALAAVVFAGLALQWDGARGPHGQPYGFNGLVHMGSRILAQATPAAREVDFRAASYDGYDGDQYVQLALDPLLSDRAALTHALDIPSYRAKRILLPALAWAAGLGKPFWIVQAYALLNAAFWLLLLLVLRRAFPAPTLEEGAATALFLLSVGVLESLRRALVDLPACALLAASILAVERSEKGLPVRAPLLFAAAALARESALLSLPLLFRRGGKQGRAFVLACAGAGLAVAGWFAYVTLRFPDVTGSISSHNFALPFAGLAGRLAAIPGNGGWLEPANRAALLGLAGLLVQAAFLFLHSRPASAAWRAGILYAALSICLGNAVLEEYYAATRALLPLTLAFHWELARTKRGAAFWLWAIPANLALLDGLGKYLFSSH